MKRRQLVGWLGAALASGALAGCTSFSPVYGDAAQAGFSSVRFNFAPPKNRFEQIILNRLAVVFPNPAGPDDPVLSINASSTATEVSKSDPYKAGEPMGVQVRAQVIIRQGGTVVFDATRVASTAYQEARLTLTGNAASAGAAETAARSAADSLRAAILAGYRPAN